MQPPRPPEPPVRMRPLPFNGAVVDALRPSVQIRLEALPLLLMCAPVFPLVHSDAWQDAPAAGAAGALLSFALVGAMCLGFLAGWLFNALACRWLLGWPADRVRALFLHSEVPPHWFEAGVRTRADAEARA